MTNKHTIGTSSFASPISWMCGPSGPKAMSAASAPTAAIRSYPTSAHAKIAASTTSWTGNCWLGPVMACVFRALISHSIKKMRTAWQHPSAINRRVPARAVIARRSRRPPSTSDPLSRTNARLDWSPASSSIPSISSPRVWRTAGG